MNNKFKNFVRDWNYKLAMKETARIADKEMDRREVTGRFASNKELQRWIVENYKFPKSEYESSGTMEDCNISVNIWR